MARANTKLLLGNTALTQENAKLIRDNYDLETKNDHLVSHNQALLRANNGMVRYLCKDAVRREGELSMGFAKQIIAVRDVVQPALAGEELAAYNLALDSARALEALYSPREPETPSSPGP